VFQTKKIIASQQEHKNLGTKKTITFPIGKFPRIIVNFIDLEVLKYSLTFSRGHLPLKLKPLVLLSLKDKSA
jgi:hypothetical protein